MKDKQKKFDIAVLGGGPGGYVAAIKASQEGKSVALIEGGQLGGTCLNRGCIPSKTLIESAKTLKKVREAEEFGIVAEKISFDFQKMVERKDDVVAKVRKSLEGLIKSNGITLLRGFGKLTGPGSIRINGEDSGEILADKIILATGSEPREMPPFPFDHKKIHDSTSMLEIQELPKSLVIVGGGIIGCEFASMYQTFDVEITIIEVLDRIIPMESVAVSTALTKAFEKKGIRIKTSSMVEKIDKSKDGVIVHLSSGEKIEADMALVATGRKLNLEGIGLEAAGVNVTEQGLVQVDEHMETNIRGIYAIGDISSRWWLAHVASHQGLVAASHACGKEARMNYNAVPSVIFTNPEIGTVGLTLEKAIEEGYRATLGAFPFQALGKAQAAIETEGFAQIVTDRETGQVLGAQVVGYEASTLVAEMAVVIANEMTIDCVSETIHAHPTVAEIWLEAALMVQDKPLHLPPQKKKAKV